jgi:ribonuclease D
VGLLAVDTESNSLHAYRERVCLLQFSTASDDYILDPLGLEDLSSLGAIFADEGIEKIFHAAEYDLIGLQRDFGYQFGNLFDTMIAARILGRAKVGLGNLLEEEFGIRLQKRYQRADWGQRPLTPEMLDYARLDTHYLIELRQRLMSQLVENERWPIAAEDFARLPKIIPNGSATPEVSVWRVKGARDLKPDQAAILAELAEYRNQKAEAADVPLFKVIGDKTLIAIAETLPHSPEELGALPGMTDGQIRRHGKGLLEAVRRGQDAPPLRRPKRERYDEAFVERLEALRKWRRDAGVAMEVESDVVLPRDLMEQIAKQFPRNQVQLAEIMGEVPWRLEHYGQQILGALGR